MERATHTIDATGKSLGRLAAAVALLLRGKQKANFERYIDQGDTVVISHIAKIKITGKKLAQKKYRHHSRYPGGLKEKTMKEIFETKPEELLRKAVWGMLPTNKLRKEQMKRLKFE